MYIPPVLWEQYKPICGPMQQSLTFWAKSAKIGKIHSKGEAYEEDCFKRICKAHRQMRREYSEGPGGHRLRRPGPARVCSDGGGRGLQAEGKEGHRGMAVPAPGKSPCPLPVR